MGKGRGKGEGEGKGWQEEGEEQMEERKGGAPPSSDLVVLRQDHEHQLEGLALVEGHAPFPLLAAPLAALHRVEDHLVPAIKARIEVQGNVCSRVLPGHEVHGKPGRTERAVPLAPPARTWRPPPGSAL